MSGISATATAAREESRDQRGRFGPQPAAESELTLDGLADEADAAVPSQYAELRGKDRVEAMKADLEAAVNELVESGELRRYLDAASGNGMRRWSSNNQMLAGIQLHHQKVRAGEADRNDPDAVWTTLTNADCRTYKQWQEVGRAPVKGSKAIFILAPIVRKKITENKAGEEQTSSYIAGFRTMPVFDVSRTDGEPLPEHPSREFTGEVATGTVEGMKSRVAELGYSYSETEIAGTDPVRLKGTLAYVEPASKKLVVDSRLSAPAKAAALAHELGHIECGHTDSDGMDEYRRHRGRMETEAEAFSYMMLRSRGAEPDDAAAFSPGYIAGWSKGETKTVQQALDKAGRAFAKADAAIAWPEEDQ